MVYCGQCGKEMKEGTRFCASCGWKVPEQVQSAPASPPSSDKPQCPSCGSALKKVNATFCGVCGVKIAKRSPEEPKSRSAGPVPATETLPKQEPLIDKESSLPLALETSEGVLAPGDAEIIFPPDETLPSRESLAALGESGRGIRKIRRGPPRLEDELSPNGPSLLYGGGQEADSSEVPSKPSEPFRSPLEEEKEIIPDAAPGAREQLKTLPVAVPRLPSPSPPPPPPSQLQSSPPQTPLAPPSSPPPPAPSASTSRDKGLEEKKSYLAWILGILGVLVVLILSGAAGFVWWLSKDIGSNAHREVQSGVNSTPTTPQPVSPPITSNTPSPSEQVATTGRIPSGDLDGNARSFIAEFCRLNNDATNPEAMLSLYDEQVDLLDAGIVGKDRVLAERRNYLKRWPEMRWDPITDSLVSTADGDNLRLSFNADFHLASAERKERIDGQATLDLVLRKVGQDWKIISEKEKVISKNKVAF